MIRRHISDALLVSITLVVAILVSAYFIESQSTISLERAKEYIVDRKIHIARIEAENDCNDVCIVNLHGDIYTVMFATEAASISFLKFCSDEHVPIEYNVCERRWNFWTNILSPFKSD
jgi:hypothetical protein